MLSLNAKIQSNLKIYEKDKRYISFLKLQLQQIPKCQIWINKNIKDLNQPTVRFSAKAINLFKAFWCNHRLTTPRWNFSLQQTKRRTFRINKLNVHLRYYSMLRIASSHSRRTANIGMWYPLVFLDKHSQLTKSACIYILQKVILIETSNKDDSGSKYWFGQ